MLTWGGRHPGHAEFCNTQTEKGPGHSRILYRGMLSELANLLDFRFHLLGDVAWQWCIGQCGSHFLTVIDHPVKEVNDDFSISCIL